MKKHIYYIDMENVQANGLKGASKINKDDCIYVYYSVHSKPRIPFEIARELTLCRGSFVFKEVVNLGKNAMDNEIIKATQKHMKKHKDCVYHIISNDKGYRKAFKEGVIFSKHI